MLKIKLCLIYAFALLVSCNKYCKICPNHTMCKYKVPEPHHRCVGFKNHLTDLDIKEILDRINERRNYIAMGYFRPLPQAANMRKISWSSELSDVAQRWAFQCDQSIKPDKEDDCRDLEGTKVGQNIATIVGVNSAVKVKIFIDIWFMESLAYRGNVAYYNSSEISRSNYFTQLIWATTSRVGCGRAAFYIKINGVRQIVDRLVCNFSPNGNIARRPIYTIGFPATQCDENFKSDNVYPGLCHRIGLVTSLHQIINPITSEIDPVSSHHNLINNDTEGSQYSPKSRNDNVLKRDNHNVHWSQSKNSGKTESNLYPKEKGHSRIHHSHDHTGDFDFLHPEQTQFGRFGSSTPISEYYMSDMFRRHRVHECTRKSVGILNDSGSTPFSTPLNPTKQCTRGQKNCAVCDTTTRMNICQNSQIPCQCNVLQPLCSINPSCLQTYNCNQVLNYCQRRHNLENSTPSRIIKDDTQINDATDNNFFDTTKIESKLKINEDTWNLDEPKRISLHKSKKLLDIRDRKRRAEESMTSKPFWQEDEFNKKQNQIKSIRYTTLGHNIKTRKGKPLKSPHTQKIVKVTEPITISSNVSHRKHPTEKYLSFEELLRLRKLNTAELSARRADAADVTETAVTESTSEYTANTPFIRLKHCTRKLTCTWTAASLGGNEGNADIGNRGSRTPPGYVEGCSRTSTCTRDYMNRNKMDTLPTPSTEGEVEEGNDEDYCEKRSLNVRRDSKVYENFDKDSKSILPLKQQDGTERKNDENASVQSDGCDCNGDYLRSKRDSLLTFKNCLKRKKHIKKREVESTLSYGDLFYLVVTKLISNWNENNNHSEKCLCNLANMQRKTIQSWIVYKITFLYLFIH